jgi:two-component system NtrC family response regulator
MTPSQASHQPLSLQQPQLLVVEDDHSQRQLVTELLQAEGYRVCNADSVPAAILQLQQQPDIALVFSDWKLGSLSGLELLDYCKAHDPTAGFVIATAYGSVSHAVEAIQAGADDYLAKPFKRQELLLAVRKGLRARSLRKQNQQLSAALGEQQQLVDIIGHAPCMQQLFQRIQRNSGKSGRSRIIWCRKRCFYRRSRG